MKKVVCLINYKNLKYGGPAEGEICTVLAELTGRSGAKIYTLVEYDGTFTNPRSDKFGQRLTFLKRNFRDVDETFADQVLKKIKEQIKEEELILLEVR